MYVDAYCVCTHSYIKYGMFDNVLFLALSAQLMLGCAVLFPLKDTHSDLQYSLCVCVCLAACSQVERWLEELHDRRRCLEVLFNNRRTILDQCRALCQLYADLGGCDSRPPRAAPAVISPCPTSV